MECNCYFSQLSEFNLNLAYTEKLSYYRYSNFSQLFFMSKSLFEYCRKHYYNNLTDNLDNTINIL